MANNRDEKTENGAISIPPPVQDHKEPDNIEQMVAAPEETEFLNQKDIKELRPKEKIAIWMAQQEHKNPGFIEGHLEKHGMMKFSTGHYVMYSKPGAKSLPRIWAPGEYEAEQNKDWSDSMGLPIKKAVTTILVKAAKSINKPFAKLSSGKKVFSGNLEDNTRYDEGAGAWEAKHSSFTPEEHNEAAGLHLNAALHDHSAGKIESRDGHLTDAVEHISRAGKASTHHKLYSKLLDKFYD